MRRLIEIGAGLLIPALLLSNVARADFDIYHGVYIYPQAWFYPNADPVNMTFGGDHATASIAYQHVVHHTDWADNLGSTMYFYDHGAFRPDDIQIGSSCVYWGCGSRYHVRFKQAADSMYPQYPYQYWTLAAAHFEEFRWCGSTPLHVATDFNGPRDLLLQTLNNTDPYLHPFWGWAYDGNTDPSPQCDGSMPFGDGWDAWMYMP